MPSPVGKQQMLRTQGLEFGDSAGHDYHLWFEGDTLYSDSADLSFVPGVVPNNSSFDNSGPIQDALNVAASNNTERNMRVVYLPSGHYYIKSQIVIPTKVILRGSNSFGCFLVAMASFPINTAMVTLGSGGTVFGCRLEDIQLDCSSISGSIGLYSIGANELCGAKKVNIVNYRDAGIRMVTDGGIVGGYNWLLDDINLNASSSATGSVGVNIKGQNTAFGYGQIRRCTVVPNAGAATQLAGIYIDGVASGDEVMGFLTDIHVEKHTSGIYFGLHSQGYAIGVTADAVTTDAVKIDTGRPVIVITVRTGGANCINDTVAPKTVPSFWTGFYNNGGSAPYLTPSAGVPTPTAGSQAGASPPTPTVGSGSTDQHGTIYFGTGTGASPGNMVHIAFSSTTILNTGLSVIVSPLNSATAALFPIGGNISNTGFDLNLGLDPADSQGATVYQVAYHVDAST